MWLRDRRLYAVACAGLFMSWSYRVGLRHLRDDPGGWMTFVSLWLPTAVALGLLVAFGIPAARRWWDHRAQRRR